MNGELAEQVGRIVEGALQRMGVKDFVEVTYQTINTKSQYVGQWRAVGKDLTLAIRDEGQFHLEGERGLHSRWRLEEEGVLLAGFKGHVNSEGELVVRFGDDIVTFRKVKEAN